MSDLDPIPLIFAGSDPSSDPELILVVGQPGSGTSRLADTVT